MRRAGGDEVGGREADDEAGDCGDCGLADRAAVNRQVGVGEGQALVEEVPLEEELDVGLGRELPNHAAVGAGRQEGVNDDEAERQQHEHEDHEHCWREEQGATLPQACAAARATALGNGKGARHQSASRRAAPGSNCSTAVSPGAKGRAVRWAF